MRSGDESLLSDYDKKLIKNLDSALLKMPKYKGDLHRSLNFGDGHEERLQAYIATMQVGAVITNSAYTSCSTVDRVHMPNGDVQISIKNSSKARDIRRYNSAEKEILYERNAKFKVLSVHSEEFYDTDLDIKRKRYNIELEEV